MRYSIVFVTLIAIGILYGCGPDMKVPDSFVQVDDMQTGWYDVRAVSADGAVITARAIDNQKNGTLEFWSTAIRGELADSGHKLTEITPVESDSGLAGTMMTFSRDTRGQEFTYTVVVFVDGRRIVVAEAAGQADIYKAHEEEIKTALLSVR